MAPSVCFPERGAKGNSSGNYCEFYRKFCREFSNDFNSELYRELTGILQLICSGFLKEVVGKSVGNAADNY